MARKNIHKGRNRHQKAARRPGEERVGREMVEELLQLSRSPDPAEREHAASFLCPCHVRRRIEEVWDALFRMMEDEDVRVRRAAWHTLEDGGKPDDPRLDRLVDRLSRTETDDRVRSFVDMFSGRRRKRAEVEFRLAGRSEFDQRGKCDFCGRDGQRVRRDLETLIPANGTSRAGLVCQSCVREAA